LYLIRPTRGTGSAGYVIGKALLCYNHPYL